MSLNPDSTIELLQVRAEMAQKYTPHSSDRQLFVNQVFPPIRRDMVSKVRNNPSEVLASVKRTKQDIESQLGIKISAPNLAAQWIMSRQGRSLGLSAVQAIESGDRTAFIFFTETKWALDAVLTSVQIVESGVAHGPGHNIDDINDLLENKIGKRSSSSEDAEFFLLDTTDVQEGLNLLMQDNTGALLIEEAAKRVKRQPSRLSRDAGIFPFFAPEFLQAGADLAQDLYRFVYPKAARVKSEEQS